ncbi:MAG: class I SAM-dependent methyltransferase [Actinomycetota bacterium]
MLETIRSEGPITFARYMEMALYQPGSGYYSSGSERTGFRGHYLTSPELDPAFGELWSNAFEQVWDQLGRPDRFDVVEVGPGEGGFAHAVLDSTTGRPFGSALAYRLVEPQSTLEERQRERLKDHANVSWSRTLEEVPQAEQGCVMANEVLDNLPVNIVERHGDEIREVYVAENDGEFRAVLGDPSTSDIEGYLDRVGVKVPEGSRFEVGLHAESFARAVADKIHWGAVIFVDYGAEAAMLAKQRLGSLVCYSGAGVDDQPLERPGEKDITVFVDWSGIRKMFDLAGLASVGPVQQRSVLVALGLRDLDTKLQEEHRRAVAEKRGADAVNALSRRQAIAALGDPGGLGGLQVMFGLKEMQPAPFMRP